MQGKTGGFLTFIMMIIVFGGFGVLLYSNAQSTQPLQAVIPTQIALTSESNPWPTILSGNFGDNTTPLPTIAIPTQHYSAPTLAQDSGPTPTSMPASALGGSELFTLAPTNAGATPTLVPSPIALVTGDAPVAVQSAPQEATTEWQPPALEPFINIDPQGRDHYWFSRPIDSSGINFGLNYYTYGSDGQQIDNPSRVHHGLDMPNPAGSVVRATGPGTIIFASTEDDPFFQNSASYGNAVVIEHDFGWEGQTLWTLYAHLQSSFVQEGQRVETGEPIALSGSTGRTSGAHLHYEIRMGTQTPLRYGDSYNPTLWMVPYVGRGTIAGKLIDQRGNTIDDALITIRTANGQYRGTTSTYNFDNTVNQVNPDINWDENFVIGDVPEGQYEVIASYSDTQTISRFVDVYEGMTTFIELQPVAPATAQPVTTETQQDQ